MCLAHRELRESHCLGSGSDCGDYYEPGQIHDQTLNVTELRALISYGFTRALGVELQVPVRMTNTGIVFRDLGGRPITPEYANIHHRNETLFGLGDIWLRGRGSIEVLGVRASALVGASLPVGKTEEDPFELGRLGLEHQHLQFGTGTVDPVLGVDLSWQSPWVQVQGYAQAHLILYRNHHGYQAGNRYGGGLVASAAVTPWLRLGVSADLIRDEPERWQGEVQQDGNLGRTDLLLGAAASLRLDQLELTVGFKVPAYIGIVMSEAEPGEVTYPGILTVGVRRRFSF